MIRSAFIATARVVETVIGHRAVIDRWDAESALDGYRVSGLVGHTARAILTPATYFQGEAQDGPTIGPAEYFVAALADRDPRQSDEHAAVRERGSVAAADGPAPLAASVATAIAELEALLGALEADRTVAVFGGFAMTVDNYLITRIVEMVIHLDDIAVSVGAPIPEAPDDAIDLAVATCVEIAALRHGHTALLRAFARRERVDSYPYAF